MNKSLKKFWLKKSNLVKWYNSPKFSYREIKKKIEWYPDGKINIYNNCVEQNLKNENKTALICINKSLDIKNFSYKELFYSVENLSIVLNKFNKKKIRVAIHASASLESAISMLACCKLGYTFSVIFEDLPKDSILTRLKLFKPDIFISRIENNSFHKIVLPIIKKYKTEEKKVIKVIKLNNQKKIKKVLNINTEKLLDNKNVSTFIKTKKVRSPNTSFVLFTSGSTGQPKGIVHSTGGYLLYSKYTCKEQFGMNNNSIVLTASDAGWINGHTYSLFGPLSFGSTSILLESPLILLNESLLNKIIYELKVSILYLPVTLIRILKSTLELKVYKKSSIKSIGSMGEPLAASVAKWFSKIFSDDKLAVVNTYFQTETGGIICSPKYNLKKPNISHGTVGKPVNKYIKISLEKKFSKKESEIKITTPWPGCLKDVINGRKFYSKYWDKEKFKLFDIGQYDRNKNLKVFGRSDDVINVRGHRIGSGEIESLLLELKFVREVCAVSCKDEIEGERIAVIYTSKKKSNNDMITNKLVGYFGSFAKPKFIFQVNHLPKTRSGKLIRRLLKLIIDSPNNKNYGDLSTMINKEIIPHLQKVIRIDQNEY